MKKTYSLALLFCFIVTGAIAQTKNVPPPPRPPQLNRPSLSAENLKHQKDQTLPDFIIMRADSSIFNTSEIHKGRKIMIVIFSPDCEHCKNFTRRLIAGIDSLQDIDFYFVTPIHDVNALRRFYNDFDLAKYKNIKVVGRDVDFFVMDFFTVRGFPCPILYDKHKKLMKVFNSAVTVRDIYDAIH